ncbi:MAG: hypothetical protein WBG17_04965 [Burkholderiaceae bacterium]
MEYREHDLVDDRANIPGRAEPSGKVRSLSIGLESIGAKRIGALAVGAVAFGVLAIGALKIGQLAISRIRIRRMDIDDLMVRRSFNDRHQLCSGRLHLIQRNGRRQVQLADRTSVDLVRVPTTPESKA